MRMHFKEHDTPMPMLSRRLLLTVLSAGTGLLLAGEMSLARLAAAAGALSPAATTAAPQSPSLAPYVPTPQDVVERMLELAQVGKDDVVYDLGSGDGRLVITAAKKYGAKGVGVDIDPERISEAKANAEKAGVQSLVEFRQQDALTVDVSPATVVTLYLLSSSNMKLRPILTKQLKAGSRIVSHQFSMGDWQPTKSETFTDSNGASRNLYLWTTDGQVRQ
jgi:SAM-dependent methyltransferase